MNYCKFGNFREGLYSRTFAYTKFRENKILSWRNNAAITDIGESCQSRDF